MKTTSIVAKFQPGSVFVLNPCHPASRFVRTITIDGRQPRIVRFVPGAAIHLDQPEREFMAAEIAAGVIGSAGRQFPEPTPKPRARLHELEKNDRDEITFEDLDPIERDFRHRRRRRW